MAQSKELGEMQGAYDPIQVEKDWYKFWEERGYFRPLSDRDPEAAKGRKSYVIVLPPPNVTGSLHLGHALTSAVQDCLTRWHRMLGDNTLWVPGLDHAGIATQVVVEKKLQKEEGKTRHDFGREEFIKRVWEWKQQYGDRINLQQRRTGASTDWSRLAFSMDEERSEATIEAFIRLFSKGIISRDTRLVNWCCALRSAISDIEVEHVDVTPGTRQRVPGYEKTVELGYFYHFFYQVEGSDEKLEVATTRPETILGDTAVAIHPDDERYKHLHGKRVKCPFRDASIPILCDGTLVDKDFGTGVVKVTPAHDPNDYECGKRWKLDFPVIFTDDGKINDFGGEFQGMKRFECREKIQKRLEEMGLSKERKPHTYRVGICSRTGDIIEPLVKPQWFADFGDAAAKAVKLAEKQPGEEHAQLRIVPESHVGIWNHWLNNLRPWCLSRQLWWGHRVPAWYATLDGPRGEDEAEDETKWIVAHNEDEARTLAAKKYDLSEEDAKTRIHLAQDEDVLDTWFSAALHPMYVLKWPNVEHPDFQTFYPTSLLETGHDILFFWVAKMVMMGLELTGKLPFTSVYLHAMVRDKDGRKMSKTLGNVLDPIDVMEGIELAAMQEKLAEGNLDPREVEKAKKCQLEQFPKGIAQCGSDALRFGLLHYTMSGKNVNLDIDRVAGYRRFCNKLWQATRFSLFFAMKEGYMPPSPTVTPEGAASYPFAARWMLSRLDFAVQKTTECLTNYEFSDAVQTVYNLWLYEFCDVYLEITKRFIDPTAKEGQEAPKLPEDLKAQQAGMFHVLWLVLDTGLKLLHPMMPFVTEELYHRLPGHKEFHADSIMIADWPTPQGHHSAQIETDMELVNKVIHQVRSVKAQLEMLPKSLPPVIISCADERYAKLLAEESENIKLLGVCGDITVQQDPVAKGYITSMVAPQITVGVAGAEVDVDKQMAKVTKKKGIVTKSLENMKKKAQAADYAQKVPVEVQNRNLEQIGAWEEEVKQLDELADTLLSLKK